MKKKQLKLLNQELKHDNNELMIPTNEMFKKYKEEYIQLLQEYEEQYQLFIHAKNITDINKIFTNIDLKRIEPFIKDNNIPKYICCIENCQKLCLYEMEYKNIIKHICWFHLCGIINKY
jgi:hypothetical protein